MSKDDCVRLINEAYSMGARIIAFSGGEPLVWEGIYDAVREANLLGFETAIYTAGNVTEQAQVFKQLRRVGLNRVIFSLYAATEALHEQITRTRGSFGKTLSAIKHSEAHGLSTELHFVATASNYDQLPNICELAKQIKIESISVLRLVPQGRGQLMKNALLTKKQNIEFVKSIRALRGNGFNIRTGSPMNVFHLNDNPMCYAGIDRLIISPDLKIYPCDAFKQISAEDVVGKFENSSISMNTLNECWTLSPYLYKVRNALKSAPINECSRCGKIETCNTGCLAQKFFAYGELGRGPDPACLVK